MLFHGRADPMVIPLHACKGKTIVLYYYPMLIVSPLFCILALILIVVLPHRLKRDKGLTILFFVVAGFASLSIIIWAIGAFLAKTR
jgi:hypothetical protein